MSRAFDRPSEVETSGAPPAAPLRRLAGNALANLLRLGTSFAVVLLVPPLLVRRLTADEYSTWMLVLQVGAYATLLDGGLQLAISRFVARESDEEGLAQTLSSAAFVFVVASGTVFALAVSASLWFPKFFKAVPAELAPSASLALLLVGGSLALTFPASVLAGYFLGRERNFVNALAGSAGKLLAAAGVLAAAWMHQRLRAMAAWTAAGTLLQTMVYGVYAFHEGLHRQLKPWSVRRARVREFLRFSTATAASQVGMLLISGLDLPVVALWDFANAGRYALAATLSNLLVVPHGAILATIIPGISVRSSQGNRNELGQELLHTTRIATALLLLAGLPLMAAMPLLLRLWAGPEYTPPTTVFAELLVAAQIIRLSLLPLALFGFSSGSQEKMLLSPAIEAVVNLAMSLLLVRIYGAAGVAAGTLIGSVAGFAVHFANSIPRLQTLTFRRRALLHYGIVDPLRTAALPAAALAAFVYFVRGTSLQIAGVILAVVVMATMLWRGVLEPGDRAAFSSLIGLGGTAEARA